MAKTSTKFMGFLKNFHFLGAHANRTAYSKVKKIITTVSMYSSVRLKMEFGSISCSSLKSSRVESMKVRVEITTIPREKKALI